MEYFGRAKTAKEQYSNAQDYEESQVGEISNKIDNYIYSNRDYEDEIKNLKEEIEKLKNANSYLLSNEQIVGTWTDGKPIYKMVVPTTISSTIPTNSWTTIATNNKLSDIDTVVDMRTIRPSEKRIEYEATLKVEGNQIKAYTDVGYYVPRYVIIEYTKNS